MPRFNVEFAAVIVADDLDAADRYAEQIAAFGMSENGSREDAALARMSVECVVQKRATEQ